MGENCSSAIVYEIFIGLVKKCEMVIDTPLVYLDLILIAIIIDIVL